MCKRLHICWLRRKASILSEAIENPSLFILWYVTDASRPVPSHVLQGKRDAGKSLEHMALQLKQAPKAAAHSMQQTFENAQHNYKFLGDFIQVLD